LHNFCFISAISGLRFITFCIILYIPWMKIKNFKIHIIDKYGFFNFLFEENLLVQKKITVDNVELTIQLYV
jgi:hypothetical protein